MGETQRGPDQEPTRREGENLSSRDFDFELWLNYGIVNGYCSDYVCSTHDGLPYTPRESDEWDEGNDPCVPAVRLFPDGKPADIQDTRYR